MANEKLYAVRDTETGKLVSDITNPRRKYWDRRGNAQAAIMNARYRAKNRKAIIPTRKRQYWNGSNSLRKENDK